MVTCGCLHIYRSHVYPDQSKRQTILVFLFVYSSGVAMTISQNVCTMCVNGAQLGSNANSALRVCYLPPRASEDSCKVVQKKNHNFLVPNFCDQLFCSPPPPKKRGKPSGSRRNTSAEILPLISVAVIFQCRLNLLTFDKNEFYFCSSLRSSYSWHSRPHHDGDYI